MESFLHALKTDKTELAHHRTCTTRDEAKRDLSACIEGFCNRHRLRSVLGCLTPVEAKEQAARVA